NDMTDVSAIGLGLMGSALARALLAAGFGVTVWNRSAEKCRSFAAQGAKVAASLADAVSAAPVILFCIDSYASSRALLGAAEVAPGLKDRLVIHLSTGAPADARAAATWFAARGAGYLDGAILCGPRVIGTPDALLLFSGPKAGFDRAGAVLRALAPEARWVGEEVGAASAIDLAWLSQLYGTFVAAAHGALICESEGVDLGLYLDVLDPAGSAKWIVTAIRDGAFDTPTATLSVWNDALRRVREHARAAGISPEVPDFVAAILDRAEAQGLGGKHIASLVKVLRSGAGKGTR
ncbi:MAG: NAD(P)-dependent oxidoreductase, partial [Paracoccaceae bacterium]